MNTKKAGDKAGTNSMNNTDKDNNFSANVTPNLDFFSDKNTQEKAQGKPEKTIQPEAAIEHVNNMAKEAKTPDFPTQVFPKKIQHILWELNDKMRFNKDLASAGIIAACSTAIGNSYELLHNNYTNKAIVWCVSVAKKSRGKSEPLKWCKKPFADKDFTSKKEHDSNVEVWEQYQSMAETEKKNVDTVSNKPEKPKDRHFQYILGNYTPETLNRVHDINKRGLMIYSDELMKWIKAFNRYSKGGEQQFMNELWNGGTVNYDRVTLSIIIENCFVSILGTIQTPFLKQLSGNDRDIDGFLERILFFFPDNLKKNMPNGKKIDASIKNQYYGIIEKLLQCDYDLNERGQIQAKQIEMEQQAADRFNNWLHEFTDLQNKTKDDNEAAILGKLEIYAYRFSLLLQLMYWACGELDNQKVRLQSVEGAIEMVNYFHYTGLKVYETIENSSGQTEISEKKLLIEIRKRNPSNSYKEILDFVQSAIKESTFRSFFNRNK